MNPPSISVAVAGAQINAEAQRQIELIAAIFSPSAADFSCAGVSQRGTQWQSGLAAYRGNGLGHARNALRV